MGGLKTGAPDFTKTSTTADGEVWRCDNCLMAVPVNPAKRHVAFSTHRDRKCLHVDSQSRDSKVAAAALDAPVATAAEAANSTVAGPSDASPAPTSTGAGTSAAAAASDSPDVPATTATPASPPVGLPIVLTAEQLQQQLEEQLDL